MNGLPRGYSSRPPALGDAEAVAGLLAACLRVDGGEGSTSAGHVVDDWHGVDLSEEAVLVVAPDGGLAGYADLVNRSFASITVYGYVHPGHRGRGIGAWLVGWGEGWAGDRLPQAPEDARVEVQNYVTSTNGGARRLLDLAGYQPVWGTYVMEINLDEAPPPPAWPAGISIQNFLPDRDGRAVFEAVEDAFRDVWGRSPGTFERCVGMTGSENFDPSLWFLAADGAEIAGTLLCKAVDGEGWIEVVGVRRPWRRRGLGLALLRHALGEYHRRGVHKVGLSVDAESATGAPKLYGRAGMVVTSSYVRYRKALRPGRGHPGPRGGGLG